MSPAFLWAPHRPWSYPVDAGHFARCGWKFSEFGRTRTMHRNWLSK